MAATAREVAATIRQGPPEGYFEEYQAKKEAERARRAAFDAAASRCSERSYEPITEEDLRRLEQLALADLTDLFSRKPHLHPLRERLLAIALCQGGALHYANGTNGVKDFDVWSFFAYGPGPQFPRRRKAVDFGRSKFGRHPADAGYTGRRVDLLGKSLDCGAKTPALLAIREYLGSGATETARMLARKPVVLIAPDGDQRIVWPIGLTRSVPTADD